jgi:transposase
LQAQFLRLKRRRGPKKAILAVAASMLTAAYYMLLRGVDYRDLGAAHFDQRHKIRLANRLLRRPHDLGLNVEIRCQHGYPRQNQSNAQAPGNQPRIDDHQDAQDDQQGGTD